MKAKETVLGSSPDKVQAKNGVSEPAKKLVQKQEKRVQVFDMGLFIGGVAGYLRSMDNPPIPFEGEYSDQPALKEAIEMFEITEAKNSEDYGNAVTALAAFKDWLDRTSWEYTEPVLYTAASLTVTLGMTTPSGTLSVSLEGLPQTDDLAAVMRKMKDDLQAALKEAFSGPFSGKKTLPETNGKLASRNGKSDEGQPEYEKEEAHIVAIRCKKYENKWYWSAMPDEGKWQQYGIPLYKDVAKKFHFDLPEESGEYDVDWLCVYELKEDGKPRRIIEIDEANSGDD